LGHVFAMTRARALRPIEATVASARIALLASTVQSAPVEANATVTARVLADSASLVLPASASPAKENPQPVQEMVIAVAMARANVILAGSLSTPNAPSATALKPALVIAPAMVPALAECANAIQDGVFFLIALVPRPVPMIAATTGPATATGPAPASRDTLALIAPFDPLAITRIAQIVLLMPPVAGVRVPLSVKILGMSRSAPRITRSSTRLTSTSPRSARSRAMPPSLLWILTRPL